MKNFYSQLAKASLVIFFYLAFSPSVFANSNITITGFYDTSSGATCTYNSNSPDCTQFQTNWGNAAGLIPVYNYINEQSYNSTTGGVAAQGNVTTLPNITSYLPGSTQSAVSVSMVPANLRAIGAQYLCSGPGGVTNRTTAPTWSGSSASFVPLDTTNQDCNVTILFQTIAATPSDTGETLYSCQSNACVQNNGGLFNSSACGGTCGIDLTNSASVSISASPSSVTVTHGTKTTSYYNVTITKTGIYGANIRAGCEVFTNDTIFNKGGGECAFVDGSNNPLPISAYGESGSASWTRYPSFYMSPSLSSWNLKLAVRNYDQYGGYSSINTHTIPIQAALVQASGGLGTPMVCNGSCTAGQNVNLVVQSENICVPTSGVTASANAKSDRTFDLTWNAVPNAASYSVEVRDQTSCASSGCGPLVLSTTVNAPTVTVNVPYGGDVSGVTNKRFGYTITTNYSPAVNPCSAIGAVLVGPVSGGGGGSTGTLDLTCNGVASATIPSGGNCNLQWTSTNLVANSCVASGNWSGNSKPTSGSQNITNITTNQTYSLTCNVNGGGTVSDTATVNITGGPTADIKCNGTGGPCTVVVGNGATLSWACTNSVSGSVTGSATYSGTSGSQSLSPFLSTGTRTYNLSCNPSSGSAATDSVQINVINSSGSYSYSINPTPNPPDFTIDSSQGWGGQVLITNTGTNVLDTINVTRAAGFGAWFSTPNPTSCGPLSVTWPGNTCIINFSGVYPSDGLTTTGLNFNESHTAQQSQPINITGIGSPTCNPSPGTIVLSSGTVNVGSTINATTPGFNSCNFNSSDNSKATVNASGVVTGVAQGLIQINASGCHDISSPGNGAANCSMTPVTLQVTNPPALYNFTVNPTTLAFSATEGSLPSTSTRTITVAVPSGYQPLTINRTYNLTSGGTTWGSVDSGTFNLSAGGSKIVTVSIIAGMPAGTYNGTVTFDGGVNAGVKNVPIEYDVSPDTSTHNVSVNVTPSWCGSVSTQPAGIDCGTTCQGSFADGSTVTFVANPKPQCIFSGWLSDCSSAGSSPVCNLLMNGSKTVGALFQIKPLDYKEF